MTTCESRNPGSADAVFEQLRETIYRGDLKPGEQLLPVKRLAEIMHVSRCTVYRAMELLINIGYVEKREGRGFFVTLPNARNPNNPFFHIMAPRTASLDELMEVRIGLEGHGVSLAAEMADDRDIAFLREALAELTGGTVTSIRSCDADIKFHMGIAFATHNSVYIDLIRHFYSYMFDNIRVLHELLYADAENLRIIDQHHYKIMDAIASRDKKSARRYMTQHILFLKAFLREQGDVI